MSTVAIIAISVIGAILTLILIAAIGLLIYVYLLVRKQIAEFTSLVQSTGVTIAKDFERIDRLIASVNGTKIEKAATEILGSIPKFLDTSTQMRQTVITFTGALKELLGQQEREISDEAIQRARQSGLLPDSYAPAAPDEHFISRSRSAAENERAREAESADNTADQLGSIAGLNTFGGDED